jgi:hypothetical protein
MNLNTAGWASPLLRLLARLDSDGVNNTTPITEINGGTISATNADIALVAKGTGATLAQVSDGTGAGGNKRGDYATDWQKTRVAATEIASGPSSVVAGGFRNTASGQESTVGGGSQNKATNFYASVGGGVSNNANGTAATATGGQSNTASANYSTIAGGFTNTASSQYSFVGGGQSNTASTGTHATVCGGQSNAASDQYAFIGGGFSNISSNRASVALGESATSSGSNSTVSGGYLNTASASGATVVGGTYNTANSSSSTVIGARGNTRSVVGYTVFAAHSNDILSSVQGAAQGGLLVLAVVTTDATPAVLVSNLQVAQSLNQVALPANSAYYFRGSVIAGVTAGGNSKAWTFEGVIKRGATAASTAIVGSVVLNTIAQDSGASAWTIAITADTTNGAIAVTVTGAAATTIRWVAKLETTEMTY